MIFLGYVTSRTYLRWPDPPRWLANFSFYEHHQSAPIAADPGTIIQAVQNLDMTADPIINALLKLRKLPGRCYQRFTQHPSPTPLTSMILALPHSPRCIKPAGSWFSDLPASSGGPRWRFIASPTPTHSPALTRLMPRSLFCVFGSSRSTASTGWSPRPSCTALPHG